MKRDDIEKLKEQIVSTLANDRDVKLGILGCNSVAIEIRAWVSQLGIGVDVPAVYSGLLSGPVASWHKQFRDIEADRITHLIVASDCEKEALIESVLRYLKPETKLLISGFGHFEFRNAGFDRCRQKTLVTSFANGYPHTLTHIYQCLENAAKLKLSGAVVEFGVFKGGTTTLLTYFIEHFGQQWPVIGFDAFSGFPPAKSPLDMYAHPDCVFPDEASVRNLAATRGIEVVSGDIVETVEAVRGKPIVLAFLDTDNYTSANSILNVIQDQVVVGGAIVFDHFTGKDRFLYTLGERMAAKRLLSDNRYFNLHGTGVFLRQSV